MPILVTVFALIDDAEVRSGSIVQLANMCLWVAAAFAAVIVIKPWSLQQRRTLRMRLAIYPLWGWVLGALLAITFPVYGWAASTDTDTRTLAGQFWHEVGDSVPLLDVPTTIGWHDPLPNYPIAVGAIFLGARIATVIVIFTVVAVEWRNFAESRRNGS